MTSKPPDPRIPAVIFYLLLPQMCGRAATALADSDTATTISCSPPNKTPFFAAPHGRQRRDEPVVGERAEPLDVRVPRYLDNIRVRYRAARLSGYLLVLFDWRL